MRKYLQYSIVMLPLLLSPAIAFSAEAINQTAIIRVDGLSCPFCAYGLEKNLKQVPGVESVTIDMSAGKATVALKSGAKVDDALLTEAVKKAGFTARGITRQ